MTADSAAIPRRDAAKACVCALCADAAELAVNLGCMLCMAWDSIGCIQARLAEVLVLFGHVERALEYAKAAQPRNRPRHFARRSLLGLLCLRSACHGTAP